MTRIRYKLKDNIMVSNQMLAGQKLVTIKLFTNTKTFVIMSSENEILANGNPANTMHKLMIEAKKMVKELGVVFSDEIRRKEEIV